MGDRKHFLDWLRVIAFGLLILFHTGLLYAPWPYNLKSPRPVPQLEWVLETFSPWRMALLFVISGVSCRFLIGKLGADGFALDRLRRLLPVILFGMFVVIPPQTWIELVSKGVTDQSFLRFWWSSYLAADQTLVAPLGKTMPTWDHLWFLVYLLVYALVFALGFGLLRIIPARPIPVGWLLAAPAIWLAAANVWINAGQPLTHALVNDWGGHLKWTGMFATGVMAATQPAFWEVVRDRRWTILPIAAALLMLQFMTDGLVWSAVSGLYAWAAICAACGFAYRHLDRPSAWLSHLNEAVLPVYVLHQPILLLTAYWVFPLRAPLALEGLVLAAVTLAGSFVIHESLIRPFAIGRALFGLQRRRA